MLKAPEFKNRAPEEIIKNIIYFDSAGFIYRSLSWLDYAKRNDNMCAILYAALDCRQGIEQLLFEELVMSVGTDLDENEYENCRGNSTKLHKIIRRLNPDYSKLAEFTKVIMSTDSRIPELHVWDHNKLMKHWGKVSDCLHWSGAPKDTYESDEWIDKTINNIENASSYIWDKISRSYTGIMRPENMAEEIFETWSKFKNNEIDANAVKRIADLALPILLQRSKA
jgi:hypothetical protein